MNRDELEGKTEAVKGKVKQAVGDLRTTPPCTTKAWRTKSRGRPRRRSGRPNGRSARRSKTSATRSRSSVCRRGRGFAMRRGRKLYPIPPTEEASAAAAAPESAFRAHSSFADRILPDGCCTGFPASRARVGSVRRLDRAARRGGGDGRDAPRPHAGPWLDYRAAAGGPSNQPCPLRGAELLGDDARLGRAQSASGRLIDRFGSRVVLTLVTVALGAGRVRDESDLVVRGACDLDDAHPRAGPERAVGRQHRHGRSLVRAPD